MACHCGSGLEFEACCNLFLSGASRPETAEALMRSRYSAYVTGNIDYLAATHDPATVTTFDQAAAARWAAEASWKRLQVVAAGEESVEFIAWFESEGRLRRHHEHSRFRRIGSIWYYTDGEARSADDRTINIGRNDPCPCGSGKK